MREPVALRLILDHDLAAWEADRESFDRLNLDSVRPDPFVSLKFLRAYLDHDEFASIHGQDLQLISFRDGPELQGYVALRRRQERRGPAGLLLNRRIDFAVTRDHEFPHIVCRPGLEQTVSDALITHLRADHSWSLVEFQNQPADGALRAAVHSAAATDARLWARDFAADAYQEVPLRFANGAQYFASLSKRMRSNVSRQARRLYTAGRVEILRVSGPAVAALLPAYLDVEARSWKAGTSVATARHPARVRFHEALLGGGVDVAGEFVGIVLDGVLIAAMLWSHGFGSAWAHEMAFDISHEELGPGQLLLLLATNDAIATGATRFHFFQQHGYYKHRWLAEEQPVANVQLMRQLSAPAARGRVGDFVRSRRSRPVGGSATARSAESRPGRAAGSCATGVDAGEAIASAEPANHREVGVAPRWSDPTASARLLRRCLQECGPSAHLFGRVEAARLLPFALG